MYVIAALISISLFAPQDPVRVTAALSASRADVGATTILRITVETGGAAPDEIRVPALPPELDIVGTSDFTQTQISIPGGRTRATRREVTIMPRQPGVYRIPPITVIIEGRTYRTTPLDLVVTGAPGRAPGRTGTGTSLHMWVRPDTVFVGQQLMVYAEATFAEDSRSRQTRPASFDPPAPAGFWVQDVDNPVTVALRVREGRTVETQTFRRILFPIDAGQFTIPPAQLHYEVRRGFLLAPETRRVASDSVRVVVLPLPAQDRPSTFAGAVGRLSVRASVSHDRIAIGQEAVVSIDITGVGHVKALPEPQLPELPGVEVFPPTQESAVETVNGVARGMKRFRWVLVPQQPGVVTVPPVEYSFFDPELRTYIAVSTDTLRLEAVPAVAGATEDTALGPLRASPGREPAGWARSPLVVAIQIVPLLLVAAATGVRRRRARPPGPREHYRRIRNDLAAIEGAPDFGRTLADLERLLIDAAVCLTGGTTADPAAGLRTQGRDAEADALIALLVDLRHGRFARRPHGAAGTHALLERTRAFLHTIRPRRRWRPTAAIVAALLVGAFAGSAVGVGSVGFDHAVALHEAGDYVAAANGFMEYARLHPRDPAGWYNLGLAARDAGDPGRAVWAWLRAARLAPRDPDLRHNLAVAGATDVARVLPPDRLAAGERVVVATVAWWVVVLAFGLPLRRRRPVRSAGAAAAVLLVALAVAAAWHAVRPPVITPLGDGAALHAGPSLHDDTLGSLAIGETARVLERRDDWLLVRMHRGRADGRDAWVLQAAVASP